ncbi:peptidase domain-containing ABC transporter [Pseudanabaena sp. PCC 6802]|uniref:peptidase domain-containing ABC transporter n=1 Tax=Pseudanabaena sp. PCC 6802 TaxID=118173 RepID=UPI000348B146|nr:peptidase domain-containing ABC transporter [Pseudanabaena sp. PCC 6802]
MPLSHSQSNQSQIESTIEQLTRKALGNILPERELHSCCKQIQILEPLPGKHFWQSDSSAAGIYVVLTGKVRILDRSDRLIISLEAGTSFGELTLLPDRYFTAYSARASVATQVGFISADLLHATLAKYPQLGEHFYQQAVLQDLTLLLRQQPCLENVSPSKLRQSLQFTQQHNIPVGKLPASLLEEKVWIIRHGELSSSFDRKSGKYLTTGSLYFPSQSDRSQTWQADRNSDLHTLSLSKWEEAIALVPELIDCMAIAETGDLGSIAYDRPISISRSTPNPANRVIEPPHANSEKRPERNSRNKIGKAYFPSPSLRVGHWWQWVTRRYPFMAQQSTADCGAACLTMVGVYWGKKLSMNRLRDLANVDRNGASLRGLASAAESIGFSTRPVKTGLTKLAEQTLPAIVHWEGKHYIVVFEIARKHVVVADPAIGQRTLSHAAFKAGWTGYALLLQPTAFLKETPEASQPMWQFLNLVKPHWLVLLEVFVASLLIQIFGLITPLFTQLILDRVVVQRSALTLTAVGLGLLLFGLFRVAMTGLRQYLLDHTANRVDLSLIIGFIKHTFQLPLSFFESRYVGDIISRVQENHKIQRFLTGEALSISLDLLTVFVYVGLMFWYSWKMALLALVVVPPFILLALIATPFLQRVSREIFNASATESSYLIQSLTGVQTVKAMAIEQNVRWRWEELFRNSIKTNFSGQIIGNTLQIFSATIETVATTGLLWFGAWLVIQNELTIGQLVAFNMLLGNVINPFRRLTVLWNQLQEVVIAVERINDVLEAQPEEDLQQPRLALPEIQGHIRFDNVTFRYHPESDVNTLENINFTVKPGQTVALVGRSGSGKTTLSRLLLGLYLPTEGKILIDGCDIASLNLRSLRQQVGVVDQDTFLFGGTIRENISTSHPGASLEEIVEAAKLAGAHSFIEELPMGYETQIGEGGGMLSGGQRQRLAIARALLSNPPLLVLDEATSHLDAESERIIQTNLNSILHNRTTFVIAHRLSTVRNADLILVLDRGVIVESGTHDELMAKRGKYFYLNQQQLASTN